MSWSQWSQPCYSSISRCSQKKQQGWYRSGALLHCCEASSFCKVVEAYSICMTYKVFIYDLFLLNSKVPLLICPQLLLSYLARAGIRWSSSYQFTIMILDWRNRSEWCLMTCSINLHTCILSQVKFGRKYKLFFFKLVRVPIMRYQLQNWSLLKNYV